jgi:hypothetical protein
MTEAERKWLRRKRSTEAATWHVLSDLEPRYLTHV